MFLGSVDVSSMDLTDEVKKELAELSKLQVYVGIPDGNGRGDGGGITNAELLYVHTHGVRQKVMRDIMNPVVESGQMTYSQAYAMWMLAHGSPLWASPPRPVIEPAIEHDQDVVARQLRKVIEAVLDGRDPRPELELAGMLGQTIARDWFTNPDNGWAPNAPQTIGEKGSDRPLIDTGELRRAITYVISEGGDNG